MRYGMRYKGRFRIYMEDIGVILLSPSLSRLGEPCTASIAQLDGKLNFSYEKQSSYLDLFHLLAVHRNSLSDFPLASLDMIDFAREDSMMVMLQKRGRWNGCEVGKLQRRR